MQPRARAPDRMSMGVERVGELRKQEIERERENPVYICTKHTHTPHTHNTRTEQTHLTIHVTTHTHTHVHTHHSICTYLLTCTHTFMHTYTFKEQKTASTNHRARMTYLIEKSVHDSRQITQNIDNINEKQKRIRVEQTDIMQKNCT